MRTEVDCSVYKRWEWGLSTHITSGIPQIPGINSRESVVMMILCQTTFDLYFSGFPAASSI